MTGLFEGLSMRVRAWLALLVIVATTLVAGGARAVAAPKLDDAVAKFLADSYGDTITAITDTAASGDPRAADILEGLADGRLTFSPTDKIVVLTDKAGKVSDAASAKVLPKTPGDATPVRLNNRVRGVLAETLGSMTMLSPDPAKRLEAALSIFKSKDASKLGLLDTALTKETVPKVRLGLDLARAAVVAGLAGHPEVERLAAVQTLRERGDQEALSVLRSIPADAPDTVKQTAAGAIKAIEGRLAVWNVAQNFYYGLSLGSVLLLAAIGLAITFGVMGVINMAHGEMVMIGAYTTFVVQEVIRQHAPGLFDYSLVIAIPAAFLVAGAIGVAIERGVIRFLYGRPLETLLATWGISLILQQAVRTIFGSSNREVGAPSFMSGAFKIGELVITWNRLWIIVFAGLIFAGLQAALKYTAFGLHMRAVTQNRRMASSMGIPTARVDALTFGLGSAIAGLAGVALAQIDNVSPNLGQSYIVDSFLVVVFGGVGNLWGTLIGALSLGLANKLLEPFAGAVLGKIILLIAVIIFIQKRPRGLFALKGRSVEA